jgi:hypothetical protein
MRRSALTGTIGLELQLNKERHHFSIGDVVVDTLNKDVGVLLRRYNLFDHESYSEYEDIIVWDIYWTGVKEWPFDEKVQTYTEDGLEILLNTGVLIHCRNI